MTMNSSVAAVFAVWARRTLWRTEDATNGALCERFAASRKRARVVWSGRRRRRTITTVTGQRINARSCSSLYLLLYNYYLLLVTTTITITILYYCLSSCLRAADSSRSLSVSSLSHRYNNIINKDKTSLQYMPNFYGKL